MTAEKRGHDVSRAVRADGDACLGDRVTASREVEHEKRNDERPESIDESPAEEDPRRGREAADVVAKSCHSKFEEEILSG